MSAQRMTHCQTLLALCDTWISAWIIATVKLGARLNLLAPAALPMRFRPSRRSLFGLLTGGKHKKKGSLRAALLLCLSS